MKYLLTLLLFSTCFAQPVWLQNKVNLNTYKSEYPELREARIRLVPQYSSDVRLGGEFYPAMYDIRNHTVNISREVDPFDFKHILFHEYAHDFYFTKLTKFQRKRWKWLFDNKPHYVSEYSMENSDENFAEWYSVLKYGTRGSEVYDGVEELFASKQARFINNLK